MTKIKIDLRDRIIDRVNYLERNLKWLAKHTGIPYYSLYACLVKKHYNVSEENLKKINSVLETKFKIEKQS